jgi:hypothetical protein
MANIRGKTSRGTRASYLGDGEGFSRSSLIQQLTSSCGAGFTEAIGCVVVVPPGSVAVGVTPANFAYTPSHREREPDRQAAGVAIVRQVL